MHIRTLLVALLATCALPASAEVLPADIGILVTAPPYNAACNGVTDDTAAFRAAIKAMRDGILPSQAVLKVPAGTCVVSDQLAFRVDPNDPASAFFNNVQLVGAGSSVTTIRLTTGAAGFQDPLNPKPILLFGSPPPAKNAATMEYVRDLQVKTGTNPGATAIDFPGSNAASLRRLLLDARGGRTGLDFSRQYPGPLLVSGVEIWGGQVGVIVGQDRYGVVLEGVKVGEYNTSSQRQSVAGVQVTSNSATLRNFKSTNTVPAVVLTDSRAAVAVDLASFLGGAPGTQAITAAAGSQIYARGAVSVSGYAGIAAGGPVNLAAATEWSNYGPALHAFPNDDAVSLMLPASNVPAGYYTDPSVVPGDWDVVTSNADIQPSLSSGKPIVYFLTLKYTYGGPYNVPSTVKRIYGNGAQICLSGSCPSTGTPTAEVFTIPAGGGADLRIEGFHFRLPAGSGGAVNHSTRRVTIADSLMAQVVTNAGELYIDGAGIGRVIANAGTKLYGYQANTEGTFPERILCNGCKGRIVGQKTERPETAARVTGGGCLELIGGQIFSNTAVPAGKSVYIAEDGLLSVAGVVETTDSTSQRFPVVMHEIRGVNSADLLDAAFPARGNGRHFPLISAHLGGCTLP